jgi:Leucine-rich repeat (LRR) protein
MPSLTTLSASQNYIAYIPQEITASQTLRVIRLNRNKISTIPGRIGDMTKLRELSIDYNMVSDLPMGFYHLTRLKTLRVEGNNITMPSEDIISRGAPAVVDWCRKRYLENEEYRMRHIIQQTQLLFIDIVERELFDQALYEPEVEIEGDIWIGCQLEYLFDDLLPQINKIWYKESLGDTVSDDSNSDSEKRAKNNDQSKRKKKINNFPFSRKEVIWAFTSYSDAYGPVIKRQKTMFKYCKCMDAAGRRGNMAICILYFDAIDTI